MLLFFGNNEFYDRNVPQSDFVGLLNLVFTKESDPSTFVQRQNSISNIFSVIAGRDILY
jgi:hypothetical protein